MSEPEITQETWANSPDAGAPHYQVGEKYSVLTPGGIRYTVCKPANADGACQSFPQHVRKEKR